jgi:amidase
MGQHYKEIAAVALKRRECAIPKELLLPAEYRHELPRNLSTVPEDSGHFSPGELEIIDTNAECILLNIKNKTWTSLEVTKAFCKAAAVAQQLVCPATQRLGNLLIGE